MKIKVKESTYRGRPILSLYDLDAKEEYKNYAILSIGVRKAKAILAVKEELEKFIQKNEEQKWKNT